MRETMKALTLWQPWASLCIKGLKKVETRSWYTNIRGRIAIHAALIRNSINNIYLLDLEFFWKAGVIGEKKEKNLPYGAVVGTVEIYDCFPIEELYGTELDTPQERAFGDWSPGRYGILLQNPVEFDKPIPAKGFQRFWNWEMKGG